MVGMGKQGTYKRRTCTLPPVLPVKSMPDLPPPDDIEMELRVSVWRSISLSSTDSEISLIVFGKILI